MHPAIYQPPPPDWALAVDELHVWRVPIGPTERELEELAEVLHPEEIARAGRYHFEVDRQRSIVSRGWLRRLLAGYLGCAPKSLEFVVGPQGKLSLDRDAGELAFNVSHSHELVLYAVAGGSDLGIDVEHVRPLQDLRAVARRNFTPSENELLTQGELSPARQLEEFFRLWTRKEAVIKGVGTGLATPLAAFDVSSHGGVPESWQRVEVPPPDTSSWLVTELAIDSGYQAALATARQPRTIRYWTIA